MRNRYFIFLVLIIFLQFFSAHAQKEQSYSYGIGLRLGDPSGLTFKKYMNGRALELSIGRSYMFLNGPRYYDKRFDHWYKDWHGDYPYYKDVHYNGYAGSFPLSIQVHYLFQKEVKGVDHLKWYWGLGAQFRHQKYYFDYQYKVQGNPQWIYARERLTDIDLGPDVVLGLEYMMPDIPLSFFGDFNLFMELADNPFAFWLQGGIGVRYNF